MQVRVMYQAGPGAPQEEFVHEDVRSFEYSHRDGLKMTMCGPLPECPITFTYDTAVIFSFSTKERGTWLAGASEDVEGEGAY